MLISVLDVAVVLVNKISNTGSNASLIRTRYQQYSRIHFSIVLIKAERNCLPKGRNADISRYKRHFKGKFDLSI